MSVYDWIETRVPGGHGSPLGRLLDVAYAIDDGADTRLQSSLNLVYLLGDQPSSKLVVFKERRALPHPGRQQRLAAIAADLRAAVVTGHSVVRLAQTAGGR